MKLRELVPNFESCKLIPKSLFTDSYAVYAVAVVSLKTVFSDKEGIVELPPVLTTREFAQGYFVNQKEAGVTYELIPAPTLEELLDCLPMGYEALGVQSTIDDISRWCKWS